MAGNYVAELAGVRMFSLAPVNLILYLPYLKPWDGTSTLNEDR